MGVDDDLLRHFAPVHLQADKDEPLMVDSEEMFHRCRRLGVPAELKVFENTHHVFQMNPILFRDKARDSFERINQFFQAYWHPDMQDPTAAIRATSKLAELRQKTYAEWLGAFKPCEGQVSEQDWTGLLVDLFSPDYFSAERKPWDKNPNSRRFIDLRDGELQISEDLGDGSRSGRRFDPTTMANPILVSTDQPNARHISFLCKFTPGGKAYKDAQAGAFEFTGVLGTAFGEKVMKINTVYNGKGGPIEGFEAPPDEFNFWLFVPM